MKKLLLFSLLSFRLSAFAGDWYVATNGTGVGTNWATATNNLQGAITACASNFAVWVSNGMYVGNFSVGAGVTVRSKTGSPSDVILNGNASGRVLTMADTSSWLIGCLVTNGHVSGDDGGGISSGSISNCVITGNTVSSGGAGGASGSMLYNCIIRGNSASQGGGGGISITCYNCLIAGNSTSGQGGGGVWSTFYNCTIAGNGNAGGLYCTFVNSVSWGNQYADDFTAGGSESYSCGIDYTGTGSITTDPLLSSNYGLLAGSPCRDTGNNNGWPGLSNTVDLAGNARICNNIVDMGAYEYQTNLPAVKLYGVNVSKIYGVEVSKIYGK